VAVLLAATVRLGGGRDECTSGSRRGGVVDDRQVPGSTVALLVTGPTVRHLRGIQGTPGTDVSV